jgi:hypothetical protein
LYGSKTERVPNLQQRWSRSYRIYGSRELTYLYDRKEVGKKTGDIAWSLPSHQVEIGKTPITMLREDYVVSDALSSGDEKTLKENSGRSRGTWRPTGSQ